MKRIIAPALGLVALTGAFALAHADDQSSRSSQSSHGHVQHPQVHSGAPSAVHVQGQAFGQQHGSGQTTGGGQTSAPPKTFQFHSGQGNVHVQGGPQPQAHPSSTFPTHVWVQPPANSSAPPKTFGFHSGQGNAHIGGNPPPTSSGAPAHVERYPGPTYKFGQRPPQTNERRQHLDRNLYRHNYQAEHRYRAHPYARPNGWFFHRWVFGEILPQIFWAQNYWIDDFWDYGLPEPPFGCEWVRYNDDALLIDRRTGEVVQVIYDVFY